MIRSRQLKNLRPLRLLEQEDEWEAFNPSDHAPRLVFSPLAWLKLQLFLHAGETEVGGFGISSEQDLLYVEDFVTVKQAVSAASVRFEDQAVADYVDACVDAGLKPQRFLRIWCHTHPGSSPLPSATDEETFSRVFGSCDWSVMFIIAKGGRTYARLAFSAGPAGNLLLPVIVDWASWPQTVLERIEDFSGLLAGWIAEYAGNIHREPSPLQIAITGEEWELGESFNPFDPTAEDQLIRLYEQENPEVPA